MPSPAHETSTLRRAKDCSVDLSKGYTPRIPAFCQRVKDIGGEVKGQFEFGLGGRGDEKLALVRWMCFVGAAVAKGEVRGWFVGKLGRMSCDWTGEDVGLSMLLGLKYFFWRESDTGSPG